MNESYEVYINDIRVKKFTTREDAHKYINKEHQEFMPYLEYNPIGAGSLEIWENGFMHIMNARKTKGKFDIIGLLDSHQQKNNPSRKVTFNEVNITKVMPCTPKRTRIYNDSKKLEKAKEGKIIEKDGKKYISKKDKNGNYKWVRHHEENYSKTSTTKRKSPKLPAKNFDEGTVKKGMDGKFWKVIITANGQKRWSKK